MHVCPHKIQKSAASIRLRRHISQINPLSLTPAVTSRLSLTSAFVRRYVFLKCYLLLSGLTGRRQGWLVKCERGGIRRVLMNLLGNSLKFTSVRHTWIFLLSTLDLVSFQDGFVHVGLRQLPLIDGMPETNVRIELAVLDTGKVQKNFPIDKLLIDSSIIGHQPKFSQGV